MGDDFLNFKTSNALAKVACKYLQNNVEGIRKERRERRRIKKEKKRKPDIK
jgi:hypothetical protein